MDKSKWSRLKSRKRTVLGWSIIIIIIGYFIIKWSNSIPVVTPKIGTVVSGDIINSIKVIWNTNITDQQTLNFGQEWTVKKVYVKEGQAVKKWDLLAELDKKTLSINMSQQGLSIQNARINYDKLINQYTAADIVWAQKNVNDTQSKLDIAKKELVILQSAQGDTVQMNSPRIQSIILNTKNAINDGKDVLDTVDEIFYITKTNSRYMDVQLYISAKNSSYKYSTETNYYTSKNKLTILNTVLLSVEWGVSASISSIGDIQQKTKDFLDSLTALVDSSYNAINNSVDGTSLTLSTIDGWSSTLSSARSKVFSRLSTLNSDISSLQNTSNDVASKQNEIKNYEAQLIIYKQTLQDMENWPSREDRQLQLNSIKQSQLSLAQLGEQGENYEITAPFDGNVDVINIKLGDKITSDIINEKSITVSNPNIYEIDMLIDQVDIVKVNKGQPVEIAFDSYPDYIITWAIWEIDPTPTTNAWVVSYTAKVVMTKGEKKIYDSMTVTVTIITEKKSNILIIPSTAIQVDSGNRIVQIMKGTEIIEKKVVVGIKDAINTEILSGLILGEQILTQRYISPDQKMVTKTGKFERPNVNGLGIWGGDPSANQGRGN
jgi:multidrug efflux pump subunit AcrA (membrane-fusion protein)